jgi:DNA repair protein RadC
LKEGVRSLSDAELLAVLLRSGIKGKDAVSLSRELLTRFGGIRGFLSADPSELRKIKGLGLAKIAALLAATEIVRRSLREEIIGRDVVRDPESVIAYLHKVHEFLESPGVPVLE